VFAAAQVNARPYWKVYASVNWWLDASNDVSNVLVLQSDGVAQS
jgi:hypothetical protein